MTPCHGPPSGCPIPSAGGECLPECRPGGCRAATLLLADGRLFHGRPLGVLGDTLRFLSVYPIRGPVLLSFVEVEPLSLHEALRANPLPLDAGNLLRLAEAAADRGLLDLALRDLDRAVEATGGDRAEVAECRGRVLRLCARRALEDALGHLAARRLDHARAALDEVLRRFPDTAAADEARRIRRILVGETLPV